MTARYNLLFQRLQKKKHGDNAVELTATQLSSLRLELKRMARKLKSEIIDEDYPLDIKRWTMISPSDQQYYQLILEDKAAKKGINIFQCKNGWCARNILQEVFKGRNLTENRRRKRTREVSILNFYLF